MKKIVVMVLAAVGLWRAFRPHDDIIPKRPRTSYTLPHRPRKFKPSQARLHPKLRQWMQP